MPTSRSRSRNRWNQFRRSAEAAPAAIRESLGRTPSENHWFQLWTRFERGAEDVSSGFTVTIKFVEPLGAHSQHLGTTITVNLGARDTIGTLKDMIANVTHIPKEELRLTHSCPCLRMTYSNMRNNGIVRGYMQGLDMENGTVIECYTRLMSRNRQPHRADDPAQWLHAGP